MKKYVNNSFINKSPLEYKNGTKAVTSLPVEIFTDGQPVTSWTMKGNTTTSGTPSPSNPVTIEGVGEETANLFSGWTFGKSLDATTGAETINGNGAVSDYISVDFNTNPTYMIKPIYIGFNSFIAAYNSSNQFLGRTAATGRSSATLNSTSFTSGTPQGTGDIAYIRITCYKTGSQTGDIHDIETIKTMAYVGTDDIPYEPYGFKISILKDLQPLTPMYFSQQLMLIDDTTDDYSSSGTATYKICKYVITGQENWIARNEGTDNCYFAISVESGISNSTPVISSHFVMVDISSTNTDVGVRVFGTNLIIRPENVSTTTTTAFRTWLADQYAAGTPVTVYYVLATPTTETVTAPTITTTGGEVSIDVDTTVKPSELDLTYHGWHEHQPLKRENGQWF